PDRRVRQHQASDTARQNRVPSVSSNEGGGRIVRPACWRIGLRLSERIRSRESGEVRISPNLDEPMWHDEMPARDLTNLPERTEIDVHAPEERMPFTRCMQRAVEPIVSWRRATN